MTGGPDAAERLRVERRAALAIGGLFTLLGLGLVAAMTIWPEGLSVPYWVGVAAASTFSLAGLSVIARSFGRPGMAGWLAFVTIPGLAVPALWIALDPAEKQCTATIGAVTGAAGDVACRAAFGLGGALTLLIAAFFIVALVRRARRRRAIEGAAAPE